MTEKILKHELFLKAREARNFAYVPYSNFRVGAAVATDDGRIFTGCNVENASYGLSNCAERTAIYKAVSEGVTKFSRLAVVADTIHPVAPCGACRQVIQEFGISEIWMYNLKGESRCVTLEELLPFGFSSDDFQHDGKRNG